MISQALTIRCEYRPDGRFFCTASVEINIRALTSDERTAALSSARTMGWRQRPTPQGHEDLCPACAVLASWFKGGEYQDHQPVGVSLDDPYIPPGRDPHPERKLVIVHRTVHEAVAWAANHALHRGSWIFGDEDCQNLRGRSGELWLYEVTPATGRLRGVIEDRVSLPTGLRLHFLPQGMLSAWRNARNAQDALGNFRTVDEHPQMQQVKRRAESIEALREKMVSPERTQVDEVDNVPEHVCSTPGWTGYSNDARTGETWECGHCQTLWVADRQDQTWTRTADRPE